MPSQSQIREEVTARIIEALEAGTAPWRRPWRTTVGANQPGRHSNFASQRAYQGVNPLLLELHSLRLGLLSRWWGTFNQWHQLGCTIKRRPANVEQGHWGCRVVFWKPLTKTVVDDEGNEEDEKLFCLRDLHRLFRRPGRGGSGCCVPNKQGRGTAPSPARLPARRRTDGRDASRHPLRRRPRILSPTASRRLLPEPSGRRLHRASAPSDLRSTWGVLRDRRP